MRAVRLSLCESRVLGPGPWPLRPPPAASPPSHPPSYSSQQGKMAEFESTLQRPRGPQQHFTSEETEAQRDQLVWLVPSFSVSAMRAPCPGKPLGPRQTGPLATFSSQVVMADPGHVPSAQLPPEVPQIQWPPGHCLPVDVPPGHLLRPSPSPSSLCPGGWASTLPRSRGHSEACF